MTIHPIRRRPGARLTLALFVFFAIRFAAQNAVATEQAPNAASRPELDLAAALRSLRAAIDAPGFSGAAVLMRGSETLFAEARGMADKAQALPNTLSTRFNIASVGKLLTASVLSRVAANGGLELASIRPAETLKERSSLFDGRLTAIDLLAHRTSVRGLIDGKGGIDRVLAARSNRDLADLVAEAQDGPIAPLRGELRYNNANYILIGEMAARMDGRSYEDSLRAVVLGPAGVTAAFSRESVPGQAAPALGYVAADFDEEAEGPPAVAADYPRQYSKGLSGARASAAGGLFISAPDLAKVGVALLGGRILPASRLEELCKTQIPVIPILIHGLGCVGVNHGPGVRRFGHNGGAPGISAEFALYPDSGLSLVVLSNHHGRAQPVLKAFETAYFGAAARLRPGMIIR